MIRLIIILLADNLYNRSMKTVLHALDSLEANLVKGLLENEGIACHVSGEYLQGGIGELPASGLIRVVVDERDYQQASGIIAGWRDAKFNA